jgi:hypothetical protein
MSQGIADLFGFDFIRRRAVATRDWQGQAGKYVKKRRRAREDICEQEDAKRPVSDLLQKARDERELQGDPPGVEELCKPDERMQLHERRHACQDAREHKQTR